MRKEKVCVVDSGVYCFWAEKMAEYFSTVYYYSPSKAPFPDLLLDSIGTGIEGVKRISDYMTCDADYFFFTDLGYYEEANYIRSQGKYCWGASESEVIEQNRELFFKTLKDVGLPPVTYKKIIGVENLGKYLRDKEDKYIKVSFYRGTMETTHWRNWKLDKDFLTEQQNDLEGMADKMIYLVCDPVDADVEFGCDTYNILGQYPKNSQWGVEVKDCGYIGTTVSFDKLPEPIKLVNDKYQQVLEEWNHRGMFNTEIRYTKERGVFTDPVMNRMPEPPGGLMCEWIENWDEIFIEGAKGNLVEPKYKTKYGCEIILKSVTAEKKGMSLEIPSKFYPFVKIKSYYKNDDIIWTVGFDKLNCGNMTEFACAVGFDDDLDKAIEKALEAAASVETRDIFYGENAAEKAKKNIEDLKKFGIVF